MKFDDEGKGRTLLNNMSLLRNESERLVNTNTFIKKEMFNKFFELVNLDVNTFGSYSNVQSDEFQEFLMNGSIELNESKSIIAKEAFYIAFPYCNINKRSMSTVSSILTTMFRLDKPVKGGRKDGKTLYVATQNIEAEMHYENINKVVEEEVTEREVVNALSTEEECKKLMEKSIEALNIITKNNYKKGFDIDELSLKSRKEKESKNLRKKAKEKNAPIFIK